MKIKIPKSTQTGIGGGISFIDNLKKASIHEVVADGDYDILLIAGATLCDRADFVDAKKKNKPIILRVDNILEDSKNRSTGMSRMREYAEGANVIVYQSDWAKHILEEICGDGIVIRNGVDSEIFYPAEIKDWGDNRIFYSKFSRNETKNFHVVQYWWREYNLIKKDDTLVLAGRFSDAIQKINNPFEFHNGENFEYRGVIEDKHLLANIIRGCDVAFLPYFADACSNTVLECQACGVPVIYHNYGGTKELVKYGVPIDYELKPTDLVELAMGKKFNLEAFKEDFSLEATGQKYDGLFQLLTDETNVEL